MSSEQTVLKVRIANTKPVELLDLTTSLTAMADEYKRHLDASGVELEDKQVHLFIKEVRSGSIEIDLIDLVNYASVTGAAVVAGNFNAVVEFAKTLKQGFDWLAGRTSVVPEMATDRQRLKNYVNMVEPIAKDNGSQIIIAPEVNGQVTGDININVLYTDANALQNTAARQIAALKEPVSGLKEKVLLRWYQTRNSLENTGDRAIIESIHPRPLKAIFNSPAIKRSMLQLSENLYSQAFIVDVMVDTIEGSPKLYKIMEMHDHIDLDLPE